VTVAIAMDIVWSVARHIRAQASATAQLVGYDLVTEAPLLLDGPNPP